MKLKSICGVILVSENPKQLAEFYSNIFDIPFEQEDHGSLDSHYGVDVGEVHLGIHPPANMGMQSVGNSSICVAYNVETLNEVMMRLTDLGAEQVIPPHDEGFGTVASYKDPDGNQFEIVELKYDFSAD